MLGSRSGCIGYSYIIKNAQIRSIVSQDTLKIYKELLLSKKGGHCRCRNVEK